MKSFIATVLLVCFLFIGENAIAQLNGPYAGEVKTIVSAIKKAKDIEYRYVMTAEYPNKQIDKLAGLAYVGNSNKCIYNANSAFEILYTDNWYFKADHKTKTVIVVNLQKHLKESYKKGLEKDLFENVTVAQYLDSFVQRYGTVHTLKKMGDTTYMELTFPAALPIKLMSIIYNSKKSSLVGYTLKTFQPWRNNQFGKNSGTTQIVTCKDFIAMPDAKKYNTDVFFQIDKDKVVLKKYKTYNLISKL